MILRYFSLFLPRNFRSDRSWNFQGLNSDACWKLAFVCKEIIPVNLSKVRVISELFKSIPLIPRPQPPRRIYFHKFLNKVARIGRYRLVRRPRYLSGDDHFVARRRVRKRNLAAEHLENNAAQRPQIRGRVGLLVLDHLRRHVLLRAHHRASAGGAGDGRALDVFEVGDVLPGVLAGLLFELDVDVFRAAEIDLWGWGKREGLRLLSNRCLQLGCCPALSLCALHCCIDRFLWSVLAELRRIKLLLEGVNLENT